VRLTEVLPGLVETGFSVVRFGGDEEKAADIYRGLTPLRPDDVAEVIAFAATRPPHVNLDQIVVKAREQATATRVHRAPRTSAAGTTG
jgi:NADP-dependent 3-hydroxy acid dehydrogenase YdfG